MLVSVQLPDNLAVAHLCEIQVADFVPRLSRGPLAMDTIAVPINLFDIIQVFVTEQIEAMLADGTVFPGKKKLGCSEALPDLSFGDRFAPSWNFKKSVRAAICWRSR